MKKRLIGIFAAAVLVLFGFLPIFGTDPEKRFDTGSLTAFANAIEYNAKMPENGARCAIVIDGKSGSVLFQKNADEKRGMASTTKIMTALVAIENCDPDREYLIPKEAVGIEGSSVYLKEGEPLTMRELLYCLMLESGNDAATAIALCCGGSVENFAKMMNSRATEMGLKNTHFSNPHGLSDETHKTTARELAIITAKAYEYPLFREIVSAKTAKVRYDGVENGRTLVNHNKLLFGYDGAIGVKTGYTMADGKCLVSAAERDGLFLIAVTLNDSSPTSTHKKLLDAGFEQFEQVGIAQKGELTALIPINDAESSFLSICNMKDISVCLPKNAEVDIMLKLPKDINAHIDAGDIVGKAVCVSGGKEVYIISFEAQETIEVRKKSFFEKLFGEHKKWKE